MGKKAPHGLAFTGERLHKREAKPERRPRKGKGYAAPAPHCTVDVEHVCTKVPVKVARQVEEPHCTVVPKLFANQPFGRSSKPNATMNPERCAIRYPSRYHTRSAKKCHTSTPEKSAPMATATVIIKNKFFL